MPVNNTLTTLKCACDSVCNDTITLKCACESVCNDTTAYLHELGHVVNKPGGQFDADFIDSLSAYGDDWSHLFIDFGWPGLVSCVCSVIVAILLWQLSKKCSARVRDRFLKIGFVIVLMLGFIVYDIGTCTGERFSLFTNAPMAILHSLGMFLLESDVSAIHEHYHNSWIYMLFFSLVHACAAIVSSLFVIKHFGYNIQAHFNMWWHSFIFSKGRAETYLFWGLNEASFRLIESINNHYKGDKKSYQIIVVRTHNNSDDTPEGRSGFARIFSFLSLRESELGRLQSLGCLTTGTYTNCADVNPTDEPQGTVDILAKKFNLYSLRKLLSKKTTSRIHILCLSDNDSENLHDVALLLGDKTINDFANKPKKADVNTADAANQEITSDSNRVVFYCHARYNGVHRVIEDLNSTDKITVKVIDSSHLNVEMLKMTPEVLPVNFVDVNTDATVSSAFNALVVGFSEVGQDSVRFLYEFGAFVKNGSPSQTVERSDFHMDVVDKEMSALAGKFVANAPAIKPSMPFIKGKENNEALICLHEMDCRSVEFYLKLEQWIKELNYIVIATDDDELNISLGVRIFKMATRYRQDLEKFCILVRAHNDDDGHIRKIAEHYNRLRSAQKAVDNAGAESPLKGTLNQNVFKRDEEAKLPIYLFGLDKEIYTYEYIIDDSLEKQAIEFKEVYEASTNPKHKFSNNREETAWMNEFKELMQLKPIKIVKEIEKDGKKEEVTTTIDVTGYYPTYGGLMALRRKQGQDFANCLHKKTKKLLAEKALNGKDYDWKKLQRKSGTTTYTTKSGESLTDEGTKILDVLARTEHLRWNAAHEILGYRHTDNFIVSCTKKCNDKSAEKGNKCKQDCSRNLGHKDEVRLIHNCIRPWQDLDEEKQSYDYNVVDVTLEIINSKAPIKE